MIFTLFILFYFIFKLYIIVLVLPNINELLLQYFVSPKVGKHFLAFHIDILLALWSRPYDYL